MQLLSVNRPNYRTLIRDVSMLQIKLFADSMRDLILVPLSISAGVLSLLWRSDNKPGTQFYHVLRAGRRSDRWINLFGAADRVYGPAGGAEQLQLDDMETIITHVEDFIAHKYNSGSFSEENKAQLNNALSLLREHQTGDKNSP